MGRFELPCSGLSRQLVYNRFFRYRWWKSLSDAVLASTWCFRLSFRALYSAGFLVTTDICGRIWPRRLYISGLCFSSRNTHGTPSNASTLSEPAANRKQTHSWENPNFRTAKQGDSTLFNANVLAYLTTVIGQLPAGFDAAGNNLQVRPLARTCCHYKYVLGLKVSNVSAGSDSQQSYLKPNKRNPIYTHISHSITGHSSYH